MIFLANVLVMNGGTTFLIRLIKERARRGQRSAVLLLSDRVDPALVETLGHDAEILRLSDFLVDRGVAARGLLGVFAPLAHRRLAKALAPFGNHIHSMGLFGSILGLRLAGGDPQKQLTVGIYHQNEYLYRPSPFHFPREVQNLFAAIPPENIVFFNESSRHNYSTHFSGADYQRSHLLPIGVTLDQEPAPLPVQPGQHIVSIGNLFPYKTYNRHIIGVVAALKERFPDIRYDIYGVGAMDEKLRSLAKTLEVDDRVTLHGPLEYSRFREVVAACDLFVGSGTSLIEAAAAKRPALIGIESIEHPVTYGYLSDARGYSYNENMPDVPKASIATMVERLFSDPIHWAQVAEDCAIKAQSFSMAVTADGLDAACAVARPIASRLSARSLTAMVLSIVAMRISEWRGRSEPFGKRHNQSY